MKITNDINNTDFLSYSNKEDDNTSLLGSLFSINLNSDETKSNDNSDSSEFIFKEEDIEIIDYLSNILPNLNIGNLDSLDFKRVKSEIKSDQSINAKTKDKILSLLESGKDYNKNLFIKLPEYHKIKKSINKNITDYKGNSKINNEISKVSPPLIKSIEQAINKNGEKSIKLNINQLDNPTKLNLNNKRLGFVKKIKKNVHPNKLYELSNSKSFKYKEKIDSTSLIDTKLSNNTNLNYINNKISDEIKKNKMNETKINDKVLNMQNSIVSGSKGNQFSQQNNASLANGGVNSMLEGILDNLDLSQKGWTTKLVSRIENAIENGGEEIEFNLKPKNLGRLKVSLSLKNGTGNVKIITENSFVTNALTQNENYLQKLFNDQGINLEFTAHDDTKYFGSKNSFNKNPNSNDKNNPLKSDKEQEQKNTITGLDDDVSSRHIVNVIA